MADYKDYIVRYNITANPAEAVTALKNLMDNAVLLEPKLNSIATSIKNIARQAKVLSNSANTKFTPTIDTATFTKQLRAMVQEVNEAAAEMRGAIRSAIGTSTHGEKMVDKAKEKSSQSFKDRFKDKTKQQLQAIKKDNEAQLKQLQGRQGTIQMAKNGLLKDPTNIYLQDALKERQLVAKMLKEENRKIDRLIKTAPTTRPSSQTSSTPVKDVIAAQTGLTPEAIKAWGKVFGANVKPKTLTLNIAGNAMETLAAINESLAALSTPKEMVVNAVLGENFKATEQRVQALARLQGKLTSGGGTTNEKTGQTTPARTIPKNLTSGQRLALSNAYKRANKYKGEIESGAIKDQAAIKDKEEKLNRSNATISKYGGTPVTLSSAKQQTPITQPKAQPLVVDVIGNVTGITPPVKPFSTPVPVIGEVTQLIQAANLSRNVTGITGEITNLVQAANLGKNVSGITGEITNFVNSVKEAVPVNVKIIESSVAESLKAVPLPMRTLDVAVRLITENIPQQLKAAAGNAPVSTSTPTPVPTPIVAPTTPTPTPKPSMAAAPTVPRPVYNPPAFTDEDAKKLENARTQAAALTKQLEKDKRNATKAHSRVRQTGTTMFDQLEQKEAAIKATEEKLKALNARIASLQQKQFQSSALRPLSTDEITKGLKAQETVTALEVKKRLTKEQKAQLAEGKSTLAALRAPSETQPEPEQPRVAAAAQQKKTTKQKTTVKKPAKLPEVPPQAKPLVTPPQIIPPIAPIAAPKVDYPSTYSSSEQPPVAAAAPIQPKAPTKTETKNVGISSKATVNVTPVIDTESILTKIAALKPKPVSVPIKLSWPTGATNKQAQIKDIQSKMPPLKLTLDPSEANTALENFIAKVKASSPQNITLTASGATPTTTQQAAVATATKAVAQAGGNGSSTAGLQTSNKVAAPSGFVGSGKNRVFFGQEKPLQSLAAPGYHWEQTKELAGRLNNPQALQYQNLQNEAVKAAERREKLSKTAQSARRIAREKLTNVAALEKQLEPLTTLQSKLASLQKPLQEARAGFEKRTKQYEKSKSLERLKRMESARAHYESLQNQAAEIQSKIDQHQIVAQAKTQALSYNEKANRLSATAISRRAELAPSVAAPKPYTEGWHQVKDEIKETRPKQTKKPMTPERRAAQERINARIHNQMLPYAKNQSQLNMLTKNARFFAEAMKGSPITYMDMPAVQKMAYLNKVANLMSHSGVKVPWALESEMRTLDKQMMAEESASKGSMYAPGKGAAARGASAANQKSFYDRFRKNSYLFTGQTSFGARTPMAVDMAKGMGVMFAISGAMSAISSSFSQAMEYQNMMKTTQAILQNGTDTYSESDFKNMTSIIREVGVKTKFSAPEVASAAKFLAMAGMDINTINNSIRPIADLALIGDQDLGEVADKMTNIMTTFSIDSSQMRAAANIMASTATRSNTDLMMLAESANYGGNMAKLYKESGASNIEAFADTMAIFGVMGNSGVQGSSAGTALRMMYMNLFNPNSKQLKMHEQLLDKYKIAMYKDKDKKQRRSMADIMIDMAAKIPQSEMADMVSRLFRITATSGAAAVLTAAGINQKDSEIALETADAGADVMSKKMNQLATLIKANRDSIHGNISESISEEKQNTLSGLWAQVTSMFTEGVVQAMEERQGGFAGMLKGIRDYFAKPETVQMIKNLLDMIIEIGKVMAGFVKIWAGFYNMAPGVIKTWVIAQMFFTQLGTLMGPVVALTGAFTRFRSVLFSLAGISATSGAAVTASVKQTSAIKASSALAAPLVVGKTKRGKNIAIKGMAARRARMAMAANAKRVTASELMLGASMMPMLTAKSLPINKIPEVQSNMEGLLMRQKRIEADNEKTRQHYAEVRDRAKRIYGTKPRMVRGFARMATAVPTMMSFSSLTSGISALFKGLMVSLAKAIGFLLNPVTLAVTAVGALGFGIYKLKQRMDGATESQKQRREFLNSQTDRGVREMVKDTQWYDDFQQKKGVDKIVIKALPISEEKKQKQSEREKTQVDFERRFGWLFNDFSTEASEQSIKDIAAKWTQTVNASPLLGFALGNRKNELTTHIVPSGPVMSPVTMQSSVGAIQAPYFADQNAEKAQITQKRLIEAAIMAEAAYDPRVKEAIIKITEINRAKKKYSASYNAQVQALKNAKDKIGELSYNEQLNKLNKDKVAADKGFTQQISDIRNKVMESFQGGIPLGPNITFEQYSKMTDRSIYQEYHTGVANLIEAYVDDLPGTVTAVLEAKEILKNRLYTNQDQWYDAVSQVINNYRVLDHFISADGQRQAELAIKLNMLPSKTIDFSGIQRQVQDKIGAFNLSLDQYLRIIGAFYDAVGDTYEILGNPDKFISDLERNLRQAPITELTAGNFYDEFISNNPQSIFWANEKDRVEFAKMATAPQEIGWGPFKRINKFKVGDKYYTPNAIRDYIYKTYAKKGAEPILEMAKERAKNEPLRIPYRPDWYEYPSQPHAVTSPSVPKAPVIETSQIVPPSVEIPKVETPSLTVPEPNNMLSPSVMPTSVNVFDKYMPQAIPSPSQESFAPQSTTNSSADQTAYASPYQGTVKTEPTINININELAHFDRTTVAANAEERDLISSMESKITEAVSQIFAQATSFA